MASPTVTMEDHRIAAEYYALDSRRKRDAADGAQDDLARATFLDQAKAGQRISARESGKARAMLFDLLG